MKELIKAAGALFLFFAMTFIVAKTTGFLSIDQVEGWLIEAQDAPPIYVMSLVVALLFLDLFITVPTLSLIILSGYFLGFQLGALASVIGLTVAGCSGYLLSYLFGDKILRRVFKDDEKRASLHATFHEHSFAMILLSRAMPMLPEVTSCISGSTRIGFGKFISAWWMSCIPYALIAAYSGSASTLDNPMPGILTAIGITGILCCGWFLFHRRQKKRLAC